MPATLVSFRRMLRRRTIDEVPPAVICDHRTFPNIGVNRATREDVVFVVDRS